MMGFAQSVHGDKSLLSPHTFPFHPPKSLHYAPQIKPKNLYHSISVHWLRSTNFNIVISHKYRKKVFNTIYTRTPFNLIKS